MTEGATGGPGARRSRILPPGGWHAERLEASEVLVLTDIDGGQCCDVLCLPLDDIEHGFSAHTTIMRNGTIGLTVGAQLFSRSNRPLLTIVEDTVGPGGHDLLAGMCSRESTFAKFGVRDAPNCRDNLTRALEPYGVGEHDLVGCFNVFMRMEVGADGRVEIKEPLSEAGDRLAVRAETACVVAMSACPQAWGATNAGRPSRIGVDVR